MALEILPSVDLRDGKVVRLQQGDYGRQISYAVDPIETARGYAAAGANWMHIVDLDGAREGRVAQAALIAKMIEASCLNVEVGGGVRSRQDIDILLKAGARRVVVGTRAIEDWAWFRSLLDDHGLADQLVLALDAKEGMVATRGWTQTSVRRAIDIAAEVSEWGIGAILYTDVARDGMMSGPNTEQTVKLAQAGRTPVIASGGVGSIEHVRGLLGKGIWGVIIGRSLYEGAVDLAEALRVAVE